MGARRWVAVVAASAVTAGGALAGAAAVGVAAAAQVAAPVGRQVPVLPERASDLVPVPVTKELTFSCQYPLIGAREVPVSISMVFTASGVLGEPIDSTDLHVRVGLDSTTLQALHLVQATTVEGSAVAGVQLDLGGTGLGVTLPGLVFSPTDVTGTAAELDITGPVPSMTPTSPGTVSVAAGTTVRTRITPRKADGSLTGLGTFDMPCTTLPGQDLAMFSVTVG